MTNLEGALGPLPGYELTPEYQEVLDQSDRFAREQLYDYQEKMDNEEWWPEDVYQKLASVGYLGVTVPEEYGGAGMDFFASTLILQSIAKWNPAISLSYGAHDNLCVNNILRNATEAQKKKYLPGLCDGTKIGALGLTEPGAGSDALGSMRTTAKREGDYYILNGSKMFITNGPNADVLLVYAKTNPDLGAKGISAFIIEKGMPGFTVAQKLTKMGYRGSPTGELVFDNCKVPAENLVGEENTGVAIVMSGLDLERTFFAVSALGTTERALELALEYAKTRQQFGKPIAAFQMIQAKLAEMYTSLEAMRSLVYRTAVACNDLEKGGGGRGDIHKISAAAILFAAENSKKIIDEAVQIFGGAGFLWESEINRLYRGIKLMEIGAGTNEVRKIIISGELLKE
ncbi:MAG: acyl-CoA dehydrogenase family protein [Rhodospirillales bacterium]|nr:acyl-CoA dehydrogenase family protein [Rhodospirillales bacterium]